MRNNQQQMDEMSAFSKVGSFIASIFKVAHATVGSQENFPVTQRSSMPSTITEEVYPVSVVRVPDWDEKPLESWEEAADRIIAEKDLTPEMFQPSSRFFTNWSQYKLIHTLYVRGEVSRRELGELVDIANIPDLVARMNRLGWSIGCQRKGMVDAIGRCRYRGFYSLSGEDR